jgi:hypothetical protein
MSSKIPTLAEKQKYLQSMLPYANIAEKKILSLGGGGGLTSNVILAQWAHETNYGTSSASQTKFNQAGIMKSGGETKGQVTFTSNAEFTSVYVGKITGFARNGKLVTAVAKATTEEAAVLALGQSGWDYRHYYGDDKNGKAIDGTPGQAITKRLHDNEFILGASTSITNNQKVSYSVVAGDNKPSVEKIYIDTASDNENMTDVVGGVLDSGDNNIISTSQAQTLLQQSSDPKTITIKNGNNQDVIKVSELNSDSMVEFGGEQLAPVMAKATALSASYVNDVIPKADEFKFAEIENMLPTSKANVLDVAANEIMNNKATTGVAAKDNLILTEDYKNDTFGADAYQAKNGGSVSSAARMRMIEGFSSTPNVQQVASTSAAQAAPVFAPFPAPILAPATSVEPPKALVFMAIDDPIVAKAEDYTAPGGEGASATTSPLGDLGISAAEKNTYAHNDSYAELDSRRGSHMTSGM